MEHECDGKEGAFLTLPTGKAVKLPMHNNCPHASEEVVEEFESLKNVKEVK